MKPAAARAELAAPRRAGAASRARAGAAGVVLAIAWLGGGATGAAAGARDAGASAGDAEARHAGASKAAARDGGTGGTVGRDAATSAVAARDGGAIPRDGGDGGDGGEHPDRPASASGASGAAEASPRPPLDGAVHAALAREVEALRTLVAGGTPPGIELGALISVALDDEGAVQAYVEQLRARLAAADADVAVGAATNAPASADGGAAPAGPDGGAAPAGPGAEGPVDAGPGASTAALLLERDRLRLEFLSRPAAQRAAARGADADRRRVAEQQERAERTRAAAQDDERRADAARLDALDAARVAVTQAQRLAAAERARVEDARALVAAARGDISRARGAAVSEAGADLERVDAMAAEATSPALTRRGADALYDRCVAALVVARDALRSALDGLDAPSVVPVFRPQPEADEAATGADREALRAAREALTREAARVVAEERDARWASVVDAATQVARLNGLRLSLLDRLSEGKREAVLGFTSEGLAQLLREIDHVRLTARYYLRRRTSAASPPAENLSRIVSIGAAALSTLELLALLALALYAHRRGRGWLDAARRWTLARVRTEALRRVVDRWLQLVVALAPALALVALVTLATRILAPFALPELAVLGPAARAYAWYRVALAATVQLLTSAAAARGVAATSALTARILSSARLVLRYALAVVVFLDASEALLGRGYLYRLVADFAWLGALPLLLVLVGRWRTGIADAYLAFFPDGRLAGTVRSTRGRRAGFFVALGAFALVAGRALTTYGRDTVLGFEQTRRALAYVFRRRLERHAETSAQADDRSAELPETLRRQFGDGPTPPELEVTPHAHHAELLPRLRRWSDGDAPGAALAVVGERGIGRSTWLAALARDVPPGCPTVRWDLRERLATAEALRPALASALGLEAHAGSLDALVAALRAGPRRLVLVDDAQFLVLRAVGGMDGFRAFLDVVGRTTTRVTWVCAFSRYAWQYADVTCRARDVFEAPLRLEPWTEAAIGALLERRMEAAAYTASYDDLVIDRVDGTAFANEVIQTGERYRRLIWDYADGNPRVALHFWLRSLVPDGPGRARVRLFAAPSADALETLGDKARFVLTAIVTHVELSAEEASRVLCYPPRECEALLGRLAGHGYVVEAAPGRFRVSTHWDHGVLRYLRRKHLLHS